MDILRFENISYRYPLTQRDLINGFSLSVGRGEVVAILGQNGTGKSTLFKLAQGDLIPTAGQIFFENKLVDQYSVLERAQKMVSLTQRVDQSLFMDLTVSENIALWCYRFQIHKAQSEFIDSMSFRERIRELQFHTVRSLSGGEQQLLLSALVFAAMPSVLFLDEHTSQLDPHISEAIMQDLFEKVRKSQTSVLMITHDLQDALTYADRIVILRYKKPHLEYQKSQHTTLAEIKDALL